MSPGSGSGRILQPQTPAAACGGTQVRNGSSSSSATWVRGCDVGQGGATWVRDALWVGEALQAGPSSGPTADAALASPLACPVVRIALLPSHPPTRSLPSHAGRASMQCSAIAGIPLLSCMYLPSYPLPVLACTHVSLYAQGRRGPFLPRARSMCPKGLGSRGAHLPQVAVHRRSGRVDPHQLAD